MALQPRGSGQTRKRSTTGTKTTTPSCESKSCDRTFKCIKQHIEYEMMQLIPEGRLARENADPLRSQLPVKLSPWCCKMCSHPAQSINSRKMYTIFTTPYLSQYTPDPLGGPRRAFTKPMLGPLGSGGSNLPTFAIQPRSREGYK